MTEAPFLGSFPNLRHRRTRQTKWIRSLVAENTLTHLDLIWPLFIRSNETDASISNLPGIMRYTVDELPYIIEQISQLQIPAVALFPFTTAELRDNEGSEALNPQNLICQAIRQIKFYNPELGIITDVALDPYTSHGHDGVLIGHHIENDLTVDVLCKQSLIQAEAGADIIAPSDMMDGRIGAIRQTLDHAGYQNKMIMSYAVKYASSFYGPFRQAVGVNSLQGLNDKKTYQLDSANSDEALREVASDLKEGADMVIIKPGMPYLDILQRVTSTFKVPTYAYQVSGEYACIKAAGENGWINGENAMMESLIAFKRAGAAGILTYAALEAAYILRKELGV